MLLRIHRQNKPLVNGKVYLPFIFALYYNRTKAIPHNSKCRYDERGAAAAKPKAHIMLDAAKVSAASGGCSEPKQGQRSQSARGFCPEARCGYRNPTLSSILATQLPCRTPSRSEALRSATDALRRLLARRSAGAVLKPSGGNCAVLPKVYTEKPASKTAGGLVLWLFRVSAGSACPIPCTR